MKYTLREYIAFPFAYMSMFFAWFSELIAGHYDDYIKGWFTKGD